MNFEKYQPRKIYINNDHRQPYMSADNFSVNLETTLEKPSALIVNSFTVPLTCYNIPSYNSTFYYYSKANASATQVLGSVNINVKRFFNTPLELIKEVNAALAAASVFLTLTHDPDTSSSTYDQFAINTQSYRVTIKNTSVTGVQYSLPGYNQIWYSMNERLGFTQASQTAFIANNQTLVGESPVNVQRTSAIYLAGDMAMGEGLTNNLIGTSTFGSAMRDIIAVVPCNSGFGSLCVFKDQNGISYSKRLPENMKTLTFRFLDDNFMPLELPSSAICTIELLVEYN